MAVFLLPAVLFMAATFLLPLLVVAYTSISGEAGLHPGSLPGTRVSASLRHSC